MGLINSLSCIRWDLFYTKQLAQIILAFFLQKLLDARNEGD